MGLRLFGSYARSVEYVTDPNKAIMPSDPDPRLFHIISLKQFGEYTLAKVKYPNCTNYSGIKISLYRCAAEQLRNTKILDPHFNETGISPIARFVPTEAGYKLAKELAQQLSRSV